MNGVEIIFFNNMDKAFDNISTYLTYKFIWNLWGIKQQKRFKSQNFRTIVTDVDTIVIFMLLGRSSFRRKRFRFEDNIK